MLLKSSSRDCKQRSSTVSKWAQTASKRLPPILTGWIQTNLSKPFGPPPRLTPYVWCLPPSFSPSSVPLCCLPWVFCLCPVLMSCWGSSCLEGWNGGHVADAMWVSFRKVYDGPWITSTFWTQELSFWTENNLLQIELPENYVALFWMDFVPWKYQLEKRTLSGLTHEEA